MHLGSSSFSEISCKVWTTYVPELVGPLSIMV